MSFVQSYLDFVSNTPFGVLEFSDRMRAVKRNDEKVFAVVRALEVIGEAAKHVPPPIRTRYPQIPWNDAAGMRDKLIHDYFGVDLRVVWRTVQEDVPELHRVLTQIVVSLDSDGE